MDLNRRLFKEARLGLALLSAAAVTGVVGGGMALAQARALSASLWQIGFVGSGWVGAAGWILALAGAAAIRALAGYASERLAGAASARILHRLRVELARRFTRSGINGVSAGSRAAVYLQGVDALDAFYSQFLPQMVFAGVLPVLFLAVAFPQDWMTGVIFLATAPLIPIFMMLIGKGTSALNQEQFGLLGKMSAVLLDTIQGLAELKALGRSQDQAGKIREVSENYREVTLQVLRWTFLSALALELLGTLSTAVIAVQIGLRLLYGKIGFEQGLFFILLAPEFYQPLRTLGLRFHARMNAVAAAKDVFAALDGETSDDHRGAQPPAGAGGARIELRGVTYTYPDRTGAAVMDVTCELQPGELTALVGPSGSGKSTLAALIMGFLDPEAGEIHIDGAALGGLAKAAWREQIAWAPQRPALFSGSLVDNIRVANREASVEEVKTALREAGLEDLLARLDEPLGSLTARFSGGEVQRIATARAFLRRNARLVLLDEPTANLDPGSEKEFLETARRLCAGKTGLMIAHRIPSALAADRILMLSGGRVIESGAPQTLLEQRGAFWNTARAWKGEQVSV